MLVLLLAASLRIAWAAAVPVVPVSDSHAYDVCAQNLAEFNTFGFEPDRPWAYWPVGTSFVYSLVYRVFDPAARGYWPAAALNAVLGVVLVGLSMAAARRWFGRREAIWTGLILAVWPTHVFFTSIIASETLFTVLCMTGLVVWPREGVSLGRLIGVGLIFAAAAYVRPTALLIPPVLIAADWLREPRMKRLASAAVSAAVVGVVMAMAIAPWAARNYHIFGRVVLISTNGGSNLWMGNNPDSTGEYQEPPSPPGMNEAERDAHRGKLAKEYILAEPVAFAKRTAVKAVKLHAKETIGVGWNLEGLKQRYPRWLGDEAMACVKALKLLSTGYWSLVLLLSLPGIVLTVRRIGLWQAMLHPAILIWAYFTAVHAVIVIQDRYHLPATPLIASLAAVTIAALPFRKAA